MEHKNSPHLHNWLIRLTTLIGLTLGACTIISGPSGVTSPTPHASSPELTDSLGQQDVTYDEGLDLAIQRDNPDSCHLITVGIRQDYIVPVTELIDECQAQFAVATSNLDYCLTLKQKPKEDSGTRTQQDICLEGLARELKQPDLCDQLHLGQSYQHTCRIRAALEPEQCEMLCNDTHCQDNCYTNLAQNLGDPEVCRQIADHLFRNSCYVSLAVELNDPDICNYLDDKNQSEACFDQVDHPPESLDGP